MVKVDQGVERLQKAEKIIRRRVLYAAGLGLIPIPIVDAAGILGVQVLMIKDLTKLYQIPFKEERVRSIIGLLVGNLGTIGVVKVIPGLGSFLGAGAAAVTGAAATYAIGRVFAQHFDSGGTLLNFDPEKTRESFERQFTEGKGKVEELFKSAKMGKESKIITVTAPGGKGSKGRPSKTEAEMIRAKLIKTLIEKRKRKARNQRVRFILLGWVAISILVFYFYPQQVSQNTNFSELDLYMQEREAKVYNLRPFERITIEDIAILESYASNSTEGVLWDHIKKVDSTFPRRLSLSTIRFVSNSEALNSGGQEQLKNIAFIMKLFPEIEAHLYGHTADRGAEFERQRIGRGRARVLKNILIQDGIPGYRLTENYIEKGSGVSNEYWGAEIVIEISSAESEVMVAPPAEFMKEEQDSRKKKNLKDEESAAQPKPRKRPIIVNPLPVDIVIQQPSGPVIKAGPAPLSPEVARIQSSLQDDDLTFPQRFDFDKVLFAGEFTTVSAAGQKQLEEFALLMKDYPKMKIRIHPHIPGQSTQNLSRREKAQFVLKWQRIGESRAKEIRSVLRQQGIARNRVDIGYQFELRTPEDQNTWNTEIVIERIK